MAITKAEQFLGKNVTVQVDRPLGTEHPRYKWEYPVNYGYIEDTASGDGKELDAYILGVDQPLTAFTGKCIAIIRRKDEQDDKLIVVPEEIDVEDEEIMEVVNFQEQFFDSTIIRK